MIRRTVVAAAAMAAMLATGHALAQTKVTFRFSDTEAEPMRRALDAFEQANPSIKVDMQRLAWPDARAQYLREAAVGSAPDVVEIVYVWTKPFGDAKALRPLDDLIAKTGIGVKGWSDFIAASFLGDPVIGAYVTGNATVGIRRASMANSPFTYGDVQDRTLSEIHDVGERER